MITVDLKINCDCQLIATDYTNYCDFGYNVSEVIVVEGITGLGYKTSELTENGISNTPAFNLLNKMLDKILDPNECYPDESDDLESDNLNCNCIKNYTSTWTIPEDGYYKYYKIIVYKDPLKGQVYWDGSTLKNGDSDLLVEDLDSYVNSEVAYKLGILNYCEPISFFSICNLKKCIMELQKNYIQNHLQWCDKAYCKQYNNNEFKFLFITVSLLDQLIECGKYNQVEKILESISTCNSICSKLKYNKKCNCHG